MLRGIYITTESGHELLIPTKDLPIEQIYNAIGKCLSRNGGGGGGGNGDDAAGPTVRIVVERSLENNWTPEDVPQEEEDDEDTTATTTTTTTTTTKPLPYPHLPLSLHPLGSKMNRSSESINGKDHYAERILAAYIKANAFRLCSTGSCWALDDLLRPIASRSRI